MDKSNLKSFAEKFFINLKCSLEWKNDSLLVSNIPKDFEDFCGKPQPYILVFEKEKETDNSELITKGSYLLKCMIDYLEGKGKTTLLKILFDIDFRNSFSDSFVLKNCELGNITKSQNYESVTRFTFTTSLQYLNEKENIPVQVCVKNGEIISLDLSSLNTIEGRKEDIRKNSMNEDYEISKEYVKKASSERIAQVGSMLRENIEKEINRINSHYGNQLKEYEDQINKLKNQISQLSAEKKEDTPHKIQRLYDMLKKYESSPLAETARKEKEFFINDEIHKHSLSVSHKLINTTLFYYPVFNFSVFLKGKTGGRILELTLDPLFKSWSEIKCDICSSSVKNLTLCSGGHLMCENCILRCKSCNNETCSKCLDKLCVHCKKEICKKCAVRCLVCRGHSCAMHQKSGVCYNCLRTCNSCGDKFNPKLLHRSSSKGLLCSSCYHKEIGKKTISSIFEK